MSLDQEAAPAMAVDVNSENTSLFALGLDAFIARAAVDAAVLARIRLTSVLRPGFM